MYPGDKDVLAALTCPTESCKATPPPYAFFALSPLHSNPDSDLLTKGRSLLGSKPNTGGSQAGWSTTSSASGVQTIFGKGRPEKPTFRERREKAWMMKGSAGPTESRKSYRNRQLQESVGDRCISIDHTHDAAKNWREPRASQASTPPAQPGSIPHFSKTPLTPATIGVECRLRPYRTSVHGSHQRHRDRRVSSRPRGLLNKA
jgi:hypothetical protein